MVDQRLTIVSEQNRGVESQAGSGVKQDLCLFLLVDDFHNKFLPVNDSSYHEYYHFNFQ